MNTIKNICENIINNENKCFKDEYNRPKSYIDLGIDENGKIIFSSTFNIKIIEIMTKSMNGIIIIINNDYKNNIIRFQYLDSEIIMDYSTDFRGHNIITFTKLTYKGDSRDFYD